jgi:hypothetical protein
VIATPKNETPAAATPAAGVHVVAAPPQQLQPLAAKATPAPLTLVETKPLHPPMKMPRTNDLVTTTGAIYKNAKLERVEADGLIISYTPPGSGMAITKVYFEDLPAHLRQQYEKKTPAVSTGRSSNPTNARASN